MWNRLTLTLLIASMASSGDGGSACPKTCQCLVTTRTSLEHPPNNSQNGTRATSTEMHCSGKIPSTSLISDDEIPNRLIVDRADPQTIHDELRDLENLWCDNENLEELSITNSSLTGLNVTLGKVTRGLSATRLNFSNNHIAEISSLRIIGAGTKSLSSLDLAKNKLARVVTNFFVNFPHLSQLNLRENRISVVEKDAFAGLEILESLDLSENRLHDLLGDVFAPLCSLQKLDLSGNDLRVLDSQWYVNLGRLRELDVSRNGLARSQILHNKTDDVGFTSKFDENIVENGALQALPFGLTVLRVADNPLMELELSLVLASGRRLETVDASRIGLSRVPPALTRSVRVLTLSGNKLTSIRSGDFDSYPLLRLLDLSKNSLRVVEEDALGRLEVLESLDLSGNRLTELPQSLPSSLVRLTLRENSIVRLTAKDLMGLCKLEKFYIDKNAISEIEEGSVSQLPLLAELDVSDNPLKQLPANTFGGPRSLVKLRMSGLTSLEWEREKRADMAFPVPAPERLVELDLSRSPALAAQLLADEAALSACKSLRVLNLAHTDLTSLRSDLAYLLPQLHTLGLADNEWNCTSDTDIYWLAEWIEQHEEILPRARCSVHPMGDVQLVELLNYHRNYTKNSQKSSVEAIIVSDNLKIEENRRTTEHVRLRSVPNHNQSATNSINNTESSVSNDSMKLIQSRIVMNNEEEEDDEHTELPELHTTRKNDDIVFEERDNSVNFVDDDKGIARRVETVVEAQELTGSEENSKSALTDSVVRAHPGMLVVFAGATLGLLATLGVVLSRRLASNAATRQMTALSRQEQQPIIAELW